MRVFSKLIKNNLQSREEAICKTSILGIISNSILAAIKIFIGLSVPSIAIISEGINNITDSLSFGITIAGIKLSSSNSLSAASKLRYMEHIGSLIISGIILSTSIRFLKKSILLIFYPVEMDISIQIAVIMGLSAVFKIFLAKFTIEQGKKYNSTSLIAVGTECRNDFIMSYANIMSFIIFLIFNVSVDAYAGIISSVFILKSTLDILQKSLKGLMKMRQKEER